MVHGHQQHMVLVAPAEQPCTKQRPLLQMKNVLCFTSRSFPDLFFLKGFWHIAKINRVETEFELREDLLKWPAIVDNEAGPEHIVTLQNFLQALFQRRFFQFSANPDAQRQIVACTATFPLIYKPQPLLCV